MFDDYWRIHRRSQDSAGKRTIKIQYSGRTTIREEYTEVPILPDAGGRRKGRLRWATNACSVDVEEECGVASGNGTRNSLCVEIDGALVGKPQEEERRFNQPVRERRRF